MVTRPTGPKSPVEEMESTILTFVQWKQEFSRPMTPQELIALANSLIDGSTIQTKLKAFQSNIRKIDTGQLTESWQRGFMKRNDYRLKSKRGYRLNHLRMQDLTEDRR